ncbi:hypothetical protein [Streptomyces sp. CB02115]|uniref:hypothetical protein n=1 Tax=Streptomyces sp. CB02115 TaxID=1703939 RepID=UPI00093E015F|nr:hypothetical protein [Streptomyces sp. CB02115]OKJ50863.1 hypothetical protein AMK28_28600 [Streptomyces sp. CB02115]
MTFIKTHPARLYAVVVAALALVAHYVPELPSALVLGLVAAVLGTGEAIQRAEDAKTATAGEGVRLDEHQDQDDAEGAAQ